MPSIQSLTVAYAALNDHGTFSEGDRISGKATLVLFKDTTVESLYVKCKGDAEVRWTRKNGDKTRTYSAYKRYFKAKQFLTPEECKETIIPKGTHIYNFSLNFPARGMPSSFRGSNGKIIYKLVVVLSRSWRMDHTVEKEIHFVSKSIPNLHSLMSQQVRSTNKEMGFFSKGRVHMDVIVDRLAFAPGETMTIVAKVNNSSSSEMTPKFCLSQDVVYRANGSSKQEGNTIHKVSDRSISPQTQKDVKCVLKIPHNQIPTIENCEIITVKYMLKVYLDISFAFDPEVVFPVVILPSGFARGSHPDGVAGPYPAGATSGPSNRDFPAPMVSMGPYPASPRSGAYAYPVNPPMSASRPEAFPAMLAHMDGGYNKPAASPYGTPFSSPSSTSMLHPPPAAPAYHPSPPATPAYHPTPPAAPAYHPSPPAAPAYHPPPSAPQFQPPPPSTFNIYPTAPTYDVQPSAPAMNFDFLSESDQPPPAYSVLFPSSTTENSDENSDAK